MASAEFSEVWIHDGSDLASYVRAKDLEVKVPFAVGGRIGDYANGRTRIIRTPSRKHTIPLDLELLSVDDYALLKLWAGRTVMVRLPQGDLIFGAYFGLDPTYQDADEVLTVSLSVGEVSHSLEV
jgi:hypothetical protein